eukprot:9663054-Karenia_brevis.AAC.1
MLPAGTRPTAIQEDALANVATRVSMYGCQPVNLGREEALRELLRIEDLYGEMPHNLAGYDRQKLRITKGDILPRDLRSALPSVEASYVRDAQS